MASKSKDSDDKGGAAEAGTAEQAQQAAGDSTVVIGPGGPQTPGGPGAGAAQTAEKVPGVVTEPLNDRAAADLGLRGPLTNDERTELEALRIRDARLKTQAGVTIDAKDVPGVRLAEAVTYIKRNGVEYAPDGERWVPLDYKSWVELRQIGAITDRRWEQLEPAPSA